MAEPQEETSESSRIAEHTRGMLTRSPTISAFVHKKDCGNKDLAVGQALSFVFEEGPKGASAKKVKEEEGGEVVPEEDEGERELGKVKSYNEEKGFAFIVSSVSTTSLVSAN